MWITKKNINKFKKPFISASLFLLAFFAIFGVLLTLLAPQKAQAGTQIKTVEFYIFQKATDPIAGDTVADTITAGNGMKNAAWGTCGDANDPSVTVNLPETGVVIRSAWVEYFMDVAAPAAAANINTRFCRSGASASTTVTHTSAIPTSAERIPAYINMDVTSHIASGTQTYFFNGRVVSGPTRTTDNAKLFITYEYDDTSTTQLKTVKYFVGCRDTADTAGATDSYTVNPKIPESSVVIQQSFIEYSLFQHGNNTTDGMVYATFNGVNPANSVGYDDNERSSHEFRTLWNTATSSVSLNASNTIGLVKVALDTVDNLMLKCAEWTINYNYDDSLSATQLRTIRYAIGQDLNTLNNTAQETLGARQIFLPDATSSQATVSSWLHYHGEPDAAAALTPQVNITGAAASSTGPAFNFQFRANSGMFHILWDIAGFFKNEWVNGDTLTAAGQCSALDACDSVFAEFFVTYAYPTSQTTGIKTAHFLETQDTSQNAAGVAHNDSFSTFLPETGTKTFRNGGTQANFTALGGATMVVTVTVDSAEVAGTDTESFTSIINDNNVGHNHRALLPHPAGGQFTSSSQSNVTSTLNHTVSAFISNAVLYSTYEYPIPQPPGNPQMQAAANQTFTVGDSATAISAITVTSTAASQITAANDIRIIIATGTTNFLWDTSDILATITGSASANASTTVSYENGSSTLVVNVTSDFANNTGITISDLGYRDFNAVTAATSTRDLKWNGQGQAPPFVRDTRTATIRGRFNVDAHTAGQEADKFAASSTYANQELFAFQLFPNDEAASTTLILDLSSITGIVTGDIASPQIFVDTNANGAVDAGETTTAFGAGTVSIAGGTGTITFTATTSTVASATSTRYILKATTTALTAGDTITFSLATSSVAADGQTSKVRLSPTSGGLPANAAHTVDAVSRTQRSFRWQNDDGANVNSNSAAAAADTALSSVRIPQRLALRAQIDNDGGGEGAGIAYKLQFQANATSGAWIDVANGNAIQASQGLAGADAAAITSAVAAANSRTFANGTWHEGTGVSAGTTVLGNAGYSELAYMIETSRAAANTTYYFRVVKNSDGLPIDSYLVFPSFTTLADASQLIQYSKDNVASLSAGTSSLTFYFDDIDYTRASTSDNLYSTSTSAVNKPVFNFRVRNSTSSFPLRISWEGQYSAASTTSIDAYRFGSTNGWVNLTSTSSPSVNTDFTLNGNLTTSTSEYYESDGTNFWTYFRIYQATSTSNLRSDLVNVEFVPAADSSADQTFQVNDAVTAISQISVRTARTPVITAANDIRIKIPSAFNMNWQTSTLIATLGGTASGKASTTVSYPDDKTLLVNILTDFAADDGLTVSGINFSSFTSASASTTLQAFYDGASDNSADALDTRIKQIRGQHSVNAHASGQESNKLDISDTSVSTAELLAFQLAPTGENATTSQVVVDLFDVVGFAAANITGAELAVDDNGNGAIGAGETTTVGGAGSVSLSGGTGSITFSTSFSNTSTLNIILRANIASVDPEDVIKFRVQPSSITSTGQTSKISLVPSGSTLSVVHSRPSKKHGGVTLVEGGGPPAVANLGGGSQSGGGSTEGGSGGGGSQGGGSQGGGGGAP